MTVHTVVVCSDVHWGAGHQKAIDIFEKFVLAEKPSLLVLAGDLVDLQAISRYDPEEDSATEVVSEIKQAVSVIQAFRTAEIPVYILSGNHEDRWRKAVIGSKAAALKGAVGLTLRDQFVGLGMPDDVRWLEEGVGCPGLFVGKRALLIRHGHIQAGRFSSSKNVPDRLLNQTPTISTLVGHHHKAGVQYRTVLGQTIVGIANPFLGADQAYNPSASWQRGWTVLSFYGASRLRDCTKFSVQQVILDDNCGFVYNGKEWKV